MKPQTHAETIPSLDGIRAIAVSLVFFAHSGLERIVPGGLGVTVFFVLSGFLITTLMRREHAATGTLSLRAFYLRRFLRLMPPLYVVVTLTLLGVALGVVSGAFTTGGLLAVLFYLGNYFVIANDFHGIPAGTGVTWSLAVEEHFYLLFPLLALVLLRRAEPRRAAAALLGSCGAILAWRCVLAFNGVGESWIGMATDTRADAILIGCALAFGRNPVLDALPARDDRRDAAIAIGCLGVLLATLAIRNEAFRLTARYSLQGLAIAPLIYLAVARADAWPARLLNARPMVYIGTISYTIYLAHQVILDALFANLPRLPWVATLLLGAALTLAVAEPMRRFVERPCAKLRKRLHRRATAVAPARPISGQQMAFRTPAISVCIATHRRPERLALLLEDLRAQRWIPAEVVVVDNDPAASAREVVLAARDRAPFPIRYSLEPRKNIAHARNATVELARGDWLAFVDDDERAPPSWLRGLAHAALRYGADGVLGPVEPIVPDEAPAWLKRGHFYAWPRMESGGVVPPNRLRFGNVMLSARILATQQQAFDPAYGLTGGEDGDLLARLVQKGARIVWCDEAIVDEPVEPARLSLKWLLKRSMRGGQDFARHALAGRYGPATRLTRTILLGRAVAQAGVATVLAVASLPLGRHHAAHWLTKASANVGKVSAFAGWHYREYA